MSRRRYGRRAVLALAGSAAAALAGCSGGERSTTESCQNSPEPASIGGESSDSGGMVVGVHPGPVGEIFYCRHGPSGHENPARFASLNPGFFHYYFVHRRKGWRVAALYVTDYSTADYRVRGAKAGA